MSERTPQSNQPPVRAIVAGLAIFLVLLVAVVAVTLSRSTPPAGPTDPAVTGPVAIVGEGAFSTGVTEVEPKAVADVELVGMDGQPARLSELQGKYTVLYFGYTFCPDFCPATLTDYRLVARALGEQADDVNFVMVSVDPNRDTPEMLASYVTRFDPNFRAYTGSFEALNTLTADLGAFYGAMDETTDRYYMVDHTASSFVLDPSGQWVTVYAFGTEVDTIVADLRAKLGE